jgi:hypothetical protein
MTTFQILVMLFFIGFFPLAAIVGAIFNLDEKFK